MGTSPKSSEPTYLHHTTVKYSTWHYTTVHYITVKYSTLHYIHAHDLVHKIVCNHRGTSPTSSEPTYLHCSTVQYITLHYSTLHYITVKYSTLHYTTVHYITVQYITAHYITYMQRTWCTKSYVTRGAQVLCHHGLTSGPCPSQQIKKESNIVSNLIRTPDELGLVQGGSDAWWDRTWPPRGIFHKS